MIKDIKRMLFSHKHCQTSNVSCAPWRRLSISCTHSWQLHCFSSNICPPGPHTITIDISTIKSHTHIITIDVCLLESHTHSLTIDICRMESHTHSITIDICLTQGHTHTITIDIHPIESITHYSTYMFYGKPRTQ